MIVNVASVNWKSHTVCSNALIVCIFSQTISDTWNRLSSIMDHRFASVDGGIVKDIVPFCRSGRQLAVVGVWSGGSWSPSTQGIVRQYRGNTLIGVWQIGGVEYPARQRVDALLLLEPQGEALPPLAGDVLVFGEGVFSRLPVVESTLTPESDAAVEVGDRRYHGVAQVREKRVEAIWLFHQVDAVIDSREVQPLWWRGKEFSARLRLFEDAKRYVVQLTLGGEQISLQRLLHTLPPLRAFVLDAGQEMLFQEKRPTNGRRLTHTYEYFEPSISAAPGSLRLFIHPSQPIQLPLYVQPDEPLRLWVRVLQAAFQRSVHGVTQPLLERIFSVDDLLKRVRQFVEVGVRYGDLRVAAPDVPSAMVIDRPVLEVVETSINILETRHLRRTGVLYALDLVRSWFRMLAEEAGQQEDWTIRFDQPWGERVSGTVPRGVVVEFSTQTHPEMRRGTGILTSIRDESERDGG
jgi:hypothetical protein